MKIYFKLLRNSGSSSRKTLSCRLVLLSLLLAWPSARGIEHGAILTGAQTTQTASPNAAADPAATSRPAGLEYPVANPEAVVLDGHARFTVLTSRLIRMEWAANGKFEDHASFVFLNRRMPVPHFTKKIVKQGVDRVLILQTDALKLTYTLSSGSDGKFTANDLQIALQVDGKAVVWHPGMANTGNLQGTTRTLDGARGGQTK